VFLMLTVLTEKETDDPSIRKARKSELMSSTGGIGTPHVVGVEFWNIQASVKQAEHTCSEGCATLLPV
jgi:hypothetical protein